MVEANVIKADVRDKIWHDISVVCFDEISINLWFEINDCIWKGASQITDQAIWNIRWNTVDLLDKEVKI